MFRPINERPSNPKNGDKYKDANNNWHIFKFGRWVNYIQKEGMEFS